VPKITIVCSQTQRGIGLVVYGPIIYEILY